MASSFQNHQEDSRLLYEQPQSKTLLFTTSLSSNLLQVDGSTTANTGIYQCTLEPDNNFDDFNDGDEHREVCHVASKLGDRLNFSWSRHGDLQLRNMQFDLSSLRSTAGKSSKKNFLYANTHGKYEHGRHEPDWEIVRAELPQEGDVYSEVLREDGQLAFHSVFRTIEELSWNDCEFDCCVKNEKIYDKWDASVGDEYKQAFVRAFIRSFAVDEHTGDVFISWEGWFKDCANAYRSSKSLQWTIGVSRLKTEDPSCTLLGDEDESYKHPSFFPRCTEPVSIVHQSSQRAAVMAYGGLSIIPASSTGASDDGKRSFLLSVLDRPDFIHGQTTSKVWSFPEGANISKDESKRRELGKGKVVDSVFFNQNVWDGGSLRVHYDPSTGKPDHLCRTVYEQGIECLPISVVVEDDGYPVVYPTAPKTEMFLSKQQTGIFCKLGDADKTQRLDWGRKTTLVTGLDVQWDHLTGQPDRIFFGCWGGEGGNGNFGSVERGGNHLMGVMKGAHADSILFLPEELEGTIDPREPPPTDHPRPCVVEARASKGYPNASSIGSNNSTFSSKSVVLGFTMLVIALCFAIYRRRRLYSGRFSSSLSNPSQKEIGFGTQYVELRNLDDASPESMPLPASMDEVVNLVL